jgi:multimeric flavodoxin WrbA
MTKTLVLNASPRKAWNTAKLLKSAAEGARSAGSEVEYIDLYDLNFTGCRSCMLCKRKGAERCHCYWKDDLSPIIDRIFRSDVLLIGTAIYLGRPTSRYFEVMERLHFCALSYDDYSNYFTGKVNVGLFVSMNATKEFYDRLYKDAFEGYARELQMLNGEVCLYPCHDTLQVADYSRYNMAGFDEGRKKLSREKNFPKDLENAYGIGQRLVRESGD